MISKCYYCSKDCVIKVVDKLSPPRKFNLILAT